ncbi:type IV secretion protein Rhs, partial [Pseudomonas yamanorum]|nr:type IV secretion protein Rhs [Pseudomonas yamanorum]
MIPAIGFFVVAAMDPKTRDVNAALNDFTHCLNTYDAWAESFWSFSALDVEQVFKVGDEVSLVAPITRALYPSSTVATCKANSPLTLVHMFQSTRFVPIGNTPVMLQEIAQDGGPLGDPIHKTIGPSGILEVTECTVDRQYRVSFYPNVSKDHVKALYASYQSEISSLEGRLRGEWTSTFKPIWESYSKAGYVDRYTSLQVAYAQGFGNVLYGLWDGIAQLYQWLADIKPNSEKLLQYISQAELAALLKLSNEAIAKGLLILSDEPLLFIYLSAMVSWMRMLPPHYMFELLGEITTEVLLNLLLLWATGGMGVAVRLGAQVLGKVKSERAREWLEQMATLGGTARMDGHAEVLKPVVLQSHAVPVKAAAVPLKVGPDQVSNPAALVREPKTAR